MLLIELIRCARKALATSFDSSLDQTLAVRIRSRPAPRVTQPWSIPMQLAEMPNPSEAIEHGVVQLATSAAVFSAFAIGFGLVLFRPPAPSDN